MNKKPIILSALLSTAFVGCPMPDAEYDCGSDYGNFEKGNADCQCLAPDDGLNSGSENKRNSTDKEVKLYLCSDYLTGDKAPDAYSRYYCKNYVCNVQKCPQGYKANDGHTDCVCDTEKGYYEKDGKCIIDCDEHFEKYNEQTNACDCDEVKGVIFKGVCTKRPDCSGEHEKYNAENNICECENNYVRNKSGSCELIATCSDDGLKYNAENNACDCDTANGFIDFNGGCVRKTVCDDTKEVYYDVKNICVCNEDGGYIKFKDECTLKAVCNNDGEEYDAATNECKCKDGYVSIEKNNTKICELSKENDCNYQQKYDASTNTCVCNESKNWVLEGASCVCKDLNNPDNVLTELDQKCVDKTGCDPVRQNYIDVSNTCECKSADHWTDVDGKCQCDEANGWVEVNNTCEKIKVCDESKQYRDTAENICKCDGSRHWIDYNGQCQCDIINGFEEINGACVCVNDEILVSEPLAGAKICQDKAVCVGHQEYNEANNICFCNADEHWVDDAIGCKCDEAKGYVYVEKDDKCAPIATCNPNEKRNAYDNTCLCDEEHHSKGEPGNCQCVDGAVNHAGICYAVGDLVPFGKYPINSETFSEMNSISWKVAIANENSLMLVSNYALTAKPFDENGQNVTWENSTIRSWLNGYNASYNKDNIDFSQVVTPSQYNGDTSFYNVAFSEKEKLQIVSTSRVYDYSTNKETTDKVALISYVEAFYNIDGTENTDDNTRLRKCSYYHQMLELDSCGEDVNSLFWLRTISTPNGNPDFICDWGDIHSYYSPTDKAAHIVTDFLGIVPTIVVDLREKSE